jgi:predicted nucleic acid-binding protein
MPDGKRLIVDANIMLSALLGHSMPFFWQLIDRGHLLFAPERQFEEVMVVMRRISRLTDDEIGDLIGELACMIVPIGIEALLTVESVARARLHNRGQPDWPMIAASLELDADIWSHDRDFFGCGQAVWTTKVLERTLEAASHD